MEDAAMPKTIQIRDLDDDVYRALARIAADEGASVPELLRREACLAARPSMKEWLDRTRQVSSGLSREHILEVFDELRGSWPNAGR
jgi:predicted CopG family antitoxin